jgi:solute carrier family 25 (mitochondrial S-adenosylmethionine transporter), member 26
VLKQNAQVVVASSSPTLKGGPSVTLRVLRGFRKNPTRLWRGYSALLARNLPFTGLQFPMFERLKTYFLEIRKRRKDGREVDGIMERAVITSASAGIAGSIAAVATTPIDVVKTRIMLQALQGKDSGGKKGRSGADGIKGLEDIVKARDKAKGRKLSVWKVGMDVWKDEGMRGLFRGGLLRAVWTAVGSGLYLGAYESGRHWLERRRGNKESKEVL